MFLSLKKIATLTLSCKRFIKLTPDPRTVQITGYTSTVNSYWVLCCSARTLIKHPQTASDFYFFLHKRFSCAKRDNRDRADLNFKGDRRVWDGETIKKLPGSSAMYIFVQDEVHYTAYVFLNGNSKFTK